jgi:hypothetical protein
VSFGRGNLTRSGRKTVLNQGLGRKNITKRWPGSGIEKGLMQRRRRWNFERSTRVDLLCGFHSGCAITKCSAFSRTPSRTSFVPLKVPCLMHAQLAVAFPVQYDVFSRAHNLTADKQRAAGTAATGSAVPIHTGAKRAVVLPARTTVGHTSTVLTWRKSSSCTWLGDGHSCDRACLRAWGFCDSMRLGEVPTVVFIVVGTRQLALNPLAVVTVVMAWSEEDTPS